MKFLTLIMYKKAMDWREPWSNRSVHASKARWQKLFGRRHHLPIVPEHFFLQSMVLARPIGFLAVFEWPKSVDAFSSYVSAKKSIGRSGTYKLAHL